MEYKTSVAKGPILHRSWRRHDELGTRSAGWRRRKQWAGPPGRMVSDGIETSINIKVNDIEQRTRFNGKKG